MEYSLGCFPEEPNAGSFMYETIAGGGELPDVFEIENVPVNYQNGHPCCVSSAVSSAKGSQDGIQLSQRVLWTMVKERDGYMPGGSYVSDNMSVVMKYGIPKYGSVNEDIHLSQDEYMSAELGTNTLYKAKENRAKSYWWIKKTDIDLQYQALVNENIPLVLVMPWYREYNGIRNDFLPEPQTFLGYHAVIFKGRRKDGKGYYRVYQNSHDHTKEKPDFYIYEKDIVRHNLSTHYIIVDMPYSEAYELHNTTFDINDPKITLIRDGKIRKVPHTFVPYLTGKVQSGGKFISKPYTIV